MGNCLLQWLLQKERKIISSTFATFPPLQNVWKHCQIFISQWLLSLFFIFPFVRLFPLKSVGSKNKFSLRNWCIFHWSITEHCSCTHEIKSTNLSVLCILVLKFQLTILKSVTLHYQTAYNIRQNYFLNHYHFLYDKKLPKQSPLASYCPFKWSIMQCGVNISKLSFQKMTKANSSLRKTAGFNLSGL